MIKLGNNNIGKIYLGSNSIGKAYLGSNLVYQAGSPTPPTMIPYIRGGGDGSYIDTGITADNTVKVIIWARNFNPTCGFLFGSRIGTRNNNYGLGSHTSVNTGSIRLDYAQELSYAQDQFVNLSGYHKYEVYQGIVKVDDTAIGSITETSFSNAYSIHLLGMNTAGTHTAMTLPADICACKIYKGGVLVRDYTPVNSPSVGLYDAVSDTVFTNAGSGGFTFGTFNANAYTPLKYVTCTWAQYFDSGIKGTYSLPIVSYFRPDASTNTMWILGGRTSVSSKRCDFQIGEDGAFYFGYQSNSPTVYNTTSQAGSDLVWVKSNNTSSLYKNNTQLGDVTGTTGSSFSTDYNIGIGSLIQAGSFMTTVAFKGRIGYIGFGSSRSYVPALVSGVAGLYDTYNDTFNPSSSSTPFIAGTTL